MTLFVVGMAFAFIICIDTTNFHATSKGVDYFNGVESRDILMLDFLSPFLSEVYRAND